MRIKPDDNATSIVDRSLAGVGRGGSWLAFILVALVGVLGAIHFAQLDLTLSHYDARAHLVVPRRVIDSLTPGWRQIGAVWLPLPHLIALPVIGWDWAYRTGFPSVAVSIAAMAVGLSALSALFWRQTQSAAVAAFAPAAIILNPNVLYLTSTPMTEPLLIGLSCLAVWSTDRWLASGTARARSVAQATVVALALTRYEGWLVAGALALWAAVSQWSGGPRRALALALPLVATVATFCLLGWATTGVWFVSSGFFEPDPVLYHRLGATVEQVWRSMVTLASPAILASGVAGLAWSLGLLVRRRPSPAIVMALLAAVALPLAAFYQGHPHRVRYMVPSVVALSALASVAIAALPRRLHVVVAVGLLGVAVWERPVFDRTAPMVTEAQWETPYRLGRVTVTAALLEIHDGTPVLASMGSLGHYMQESSRAGVPLSTFLHEGNGDLWMAALEHPERHVRWVLVEERAEGGDMVATRARADQQYLARFTRVAEGGGVVLYRRRD